MIIIRSTTPSKHRQRQKLLAWALATNLEAETSQGDAWDSRAIQWARRQDEKRGRRWSAQ